MAFHAHSGWYFARETDAEDAGVLVTYPGGVVAFDAGTWASIVASVSKDGETGETFAAAESLHAGTWR